MRLRSVFSASSSNRTLPSLGTNGCQCPNRRTSACLSPHIRPLFQRNPAAHTALECGVYAVERSASPWIAPRRSAVRNRLDPLLLPANDHLSHASPRHVPWAFGIRSRPGQVASPYLGSEPVQYPEALGRIRAHHGSEPPARGRRWWSVGDHPHPGASRTWGKTAWRRVPSAKRTRSSTSTQVTLLPGS